MFHVTKLRSRADTHLQMQATRKTRRMTRMAEQTAMMTRLWKVLWMPAPVSRIRMFSQLSNSEPESEHESWPGSDSDSQGGRGGGGRDHRGGGHEEESSQSSSRYRASLQAESRLNRSVSGSSIII